MEKKLKDPIGMLCGSLETIQASALGKIGYLRKSAMTTNLEGFTVDTCNTIDNGWETGIEPIRKDWIIVESYLDMLCAKVGYEKWVKSLTDNPGQELKDINYE